MDRPVLMLFVGTRGVRIADTCNPLQPLADVILVTSRDILDRRADTLDESVQVQDIVIAPRQDQILDAALEYAATHRVDGALSFSDDLVHVTAAFAEHRGLPGQPVATIPRFRDKYVQRRALHEAGVPVPPHFLITGPDQAAAALDAVPLPAMLKPTRGSGAALAYVIAEPQQLGPAVEEAFAHTARAGGAVEPDTAFILEGLLVGQDVHPVPGFAPYVSVESVAVDGTLTHLSVTDRFPLSPPALETGMMLPSARPDAERERITEMTDRALTALGFRQGIAHTELMTTADGPRIIEVNARAGGALPYLFPMVSDVDLVREAGRAALGLPCARRAEFRGYGVFIAPQHPVGVVVNSVEGLDEVGDLPGVRAVIPLALGGTRTDGFRDTLVAAILATAATPAEAVRLWHQVMWTVRADYLPGTVADHHRRAPRSITSYGGSGVVEALPPILWTEGRTTT